MIVHAAVRAATALGPGIHRILAAGIATYVAIGHDGQSVSWLALPVDLNEGPAVLYLARELAKYDAGDRAGLSVVPGALSAPRSTASYAPPACVHLTLVRPSRLPRDRSARSLQQSTS